MCESKCIAVLMAYISRFEVSQYQHYPIWPLCLSLLPLSNRPSLFFVLHPSLSDAQTGVVAAVSPQPAAQCELV